MPLKDPQAKLEYQRRWNRNKMNKGYGKWLYERRSLRFKDAVYFREALEAIQDVSRDPAVLAIVQEALEASALREEQVGPAPKASGIQPQKKSADSLLEVVAKLELPS